MSESKKAMTVQEAREALAKPKVITLPSGLLVKVRHLTPFDFIKEGLSNIPNEFYGFIADLHQGKFEAGKEDEQKTKENLEIFEKFVNITLEKGVLEPPMTFRFEKEKAETHLLYSELSAQDQAVLIGVIIGKSA